jgi:predicted aconitase with swiveling domain
VTELGPLSVERVLVAAPTDVEGDLLVLAEPLSLWGGLDAATGRIVDPRHPQAGASMVDRVVAMPHGRGSSSASAILLEAVRRGTSPPALLLRETDGILALGAAVARELYDRCPAVVVLAAADFDRLSTGARVRVGVSGAVELLAPVPGAPGAQPQSTT